MLRLFSRARRSEDGAALAEFALVLPVLMVLVVGTIEAGLLFQLKNSMTFNTRSVTRDIALGNLSGLEGSTLLQSRLQQYANLAYQITIIEPDPDDPTSTDVVVTVTLPQQQVESYAITGLLVVGDFSSTATMRQIN